MNPIVESANRAEQQAVVERETKQLVKAYSEADLEKQKSISVQLRRDLFMHPDRPRTSEEVYKYFLVTYGLVLGTTVSDPQWTSPFEWAYHMYKDTYATTLTIGPRGGGKSYPTAVVTYDKCAHLPGYTAAHASAQVDQGLVTQAYLANFSEDDALNYGLDKKGIGKNKGEWLTTRANWQIAGTTMSKISGKHPNMLTMDEIEFADESMIEQSWAVPMTKNGYKGTWVGFSTRQRASGMMNKLIQDSETGKRTIQIFQWSIFESMEPCQTCVALDQHPHGGTAEVEAARCNACPLWEWCRGEKAKKVSGWMKREDVVNTMSRMNRDSIETQLLCLRPSTHGMVLHNFRHDHANASEKSKGNYFEWKHQKDLPFYVWIDPAETKKGCAAFVQVYNGAIFMFDEIVDDSGPTTEDMKEAVHKKCREGGYGEPARVVIDPRRTDTKKIWNAGTIEGIGKDHCFNAVFPNIKNGMDDIEAGLDLVRTYILNGIGVRRFFVNPITCPKYVEAITNNMYKVDKNNQIHQNTKQNEKYKDEIDSIRYGIIDMHRSGFGASV